MISDTWVYYNSPLGRGFSCQCDTVTTEQLQFPGPQAAPAASPSQELSPPCSPCPRALPASLTQVLPCLLTQQHWGHSSRAHFQLLQLLLPVPLCTWGLIFSLHHTNLPQLCCSRENQISYNSSFLIGWKNKTRGNIVKPAFSLSFAASRQSWWKGSWGWVCWFFSIIPNGLKRGIISLRILPL